MPIIPRWTDQWLLSQIQKGMRAAPIQLGIKDGPVVSPLNDTPPVAAMVIQDRGVLTALLRDPEMNFGDAYADGRIDVEGDLVRFLEAIYQSVDNTATAGRWYSGLASKWLDFLQNNSLSGSRHNIHRHYDLGNDFYKLWLDERMVYTCAYFPTPESSLEEAQFAKLDHVSRKLRLQPGETVVEAGCGWGALALHMAREYGVNVKAFNVSREQITFARERARAEGLSHQVEFVEDDYRNITGRFDVFVSVGMLEHVGAAHYKEFARVIQRTIGDSGRGLLHFIGRNYPAIFSRWIRKQIFPGAYAPSLRESLTLLEANDYAVNDVENLRMHYAKTLEHWLERFERSRAQIAAMYDSSFVRAWRLYLAGSMAAFRCGHLQLFQVLFTGSKLEPLFWTRDPLYASAKPAPEKAKWMHAMS